MPERIGAFLRSCSGTAAMEFAFIGPVLLAMFGGAVEIGNIFQVYNSVNRLATQYAITWSDCSDLPVGSCNTELSSFGSTVLATNIVPNLKPSSLTLRMFQVTMNGTTPTVTYAYPLGTSMSATEISGAQGVLNNGQVGVVVTASYAYSLQYFQTLLQPYFGSALTASFTSTQLKG